MSRCGCSMTSVTGSFVAYGADPNLDLINRANRYREAKDMGGFDQREYVGRLANPRSDRRILNPLTNYPNMDMPKNLDAMET